MSHNKLLSDLELVLGCEPGTLANRVNVIADPDKQNKTAEEFICGVVINGKLEFTCFPKLPAQLRLKIWKEASLVPRNIDVAVRKFFLSFEEDGKSKNWDGEPYQFFSTSPPPAILHVCKESRDEGLKYYRADFGVDGVWMMQVSEKSYTKFSMSFEPRIYINWDIDRVCLFSPGNLGTIASVDEGFGGVHGTERSEALGELFKDRGLKHLAFCCHEFWYIKDVVLHAIPVGGALKELIMFDAHGWGTGDNKDRSGGARYGRLGYSHKQHGPITFDDNFKTYWADAKMWRDREESDLRRDIEDPESEFYEYKFGDLSEEDAAEMRCQVAASPFNIVYRQVLWSGETPYLLRKKTPAAM